MSISKRLRIILQVGFLIVLVLSLANCGPAAGNQPTSSIVIVIPEDPFNFNAAVGDTGYDALVMHMTLLGLTGLDPDGNVYPQLAAELPTVDNGGVLVDEEAGTMDVSWRLRDDVFWADGQPVTTDDVIFTYEAITNPDTGTWILGIDYVDGIDKIDDHSFVIHFNTLYPGYLTLFGGEQIVIWPKHYCQADQGFTAWDCGRNPLSDGPYLLKEWVTGDHLTFERNSTYIEKGKPQIANVVVKIVPDATVRVTMMRQGDADVLMWATEQVADDLKNEANVKVSISTSGRWVMRLFMNLAAKGSTDLVADPNPFFFRRERASGSPPGD
jgi:peptide/nickel transport system substrate-binding protein